MIVSAQKTDSPEEMLRKNAVEIVKNMQRLRDDRGDLESVEGENRLARRRTIQNLVNQQQRRQPIGTLDVAFRKRFQQLSNQTSEGECWRSAAGRHTEVNLPVSHPYGTG